MQSVSTVWGQLSQLISFEQLTSPGMHAVCSNVFVLKMLKSAGYP